MNPSTAHDVGLLILAVLAVVAVLGVGIEIAAFFSNWPRWPRKW